MKDYAKYSDLELYEMLCFPKPFSERAFGELYARYSQKIYAYCLRLLGNTQDAADVYQDVFLKLYNEGAEEKKIANVGAVIFKIAHNFAVNLMKSQKKTVQIEDYHIFTGDNQFEEKELMEIMAYALGTLDHEMREAFILRVYQGLSYEEIEKLIGEKSGLIRTRVWRAKEKIKLIFEKYLQNV